MFCINTKRDGGDINFIHPNKTNIFRLILVVVVVVVV
jgi:hypothetical protein